MLLPDGNNPPGDSVASLWAQGAQFAKTQQGENESEEQALPDNNETKLRAHLFALTVASLKVGCHFDSSFLSLRHPHHAPLIALQGAQGNPRSNQVHFDTDSFPIGVNIYASYYMVNSPYLLEKLVLSNKGMVDGMNDGLENWGKGTFKFPIRDDNGRLHNIRIPRSPYIPWLKKCLLPPQDWAQMVADNKAWMGNYMQCCILYWHGGQKTVLFSTSPTLQPSSRLLPCACIRHLPLHLRPWRPCSSKRGSPSSS
jgi:hypothetical protein